MLNKPVTNPNDPFANANDAIRGDMQRRVRLAALPAQPGETVKGEIRRAAQRLGLEHGLVRRLWYGLQRRIDAATFVHVTRATEHLELLQVRIIDLERELAEVHRGAGAQDGALGRQPDGGHGD